MNVDLRWDLLTNSSANLGNALVGAAGQIRQRRDQAQDRSAVTNYLNNPQDQQAFTGLAERNPAMAFRLRDEQRQQLAQLNAQQREELRLAGRLLRNEDGTPVDAAGFERARAAAARLNLDLNGVPETYDPNWVGQTIAAAQALEAPAQQEEYTLGRGDVRFRGGREIARGAAPPDQVVAVPAGGRAEVISPTWPGSTPSQAAPQIAVNPQTGEQLILNPQTNQWEPVQGGPQASRPAGGF